MTTTEHLVFAKPSSSTPDPPPIHLKNLKATDIKNDDRSNLYCSARRTYAVKSPSPHLPVHHLHLHTPIKERVPHPNRHSSVLALLHSTKSRFLSRLTCQCHVKPHGHLLPLNHHVTPSNVLDSSSDQIGRWIHKRARTQLVWLRPRQASPLIRH